ncbi:MAG: VWA domain-containing protein, partial [Acidilobaceae archaeon]
LGKAISNYIAYLLTREEGYLNYSIYLAETVDSESLDPRLRPLLYSLIKADSKALLAHLSKLMPFEALEVISNRVWEEAALRGGPEEETLLRAIELGMRILQGIYSKRGAPRGIMKRSAKRGRLAVRETIMKRLRFSEELVYKSRRRAPRVVALLDVSGSMYRYSLWAILSLASISNLTASAVLFSERARAYKFPRKKLKPLLAKYLERWFSEGFRGYTDISGALRSADAICERLGCDTIVIFSDLEQTMPGEGPWDVARGLVKRGRRIIAFVPSGAEAELVEAMRASGCEVREVPDPERIPNILKRLIHV